ncbi:Exosome complex component RRP41 [Triplophysa tibetana]|uniref:Exosome complex component RRP41 n=1 Tax=Triplophysa tibetana TaxID=1572043 RepID=A0A5A9PEN8_9TELE|nr:Exosome complex component RRP41 [Triplophysa tibetana]
MAGLELLSDQGYRLDGRKAPELRKVQARMSVFAQADGSAYLEQGNTKALAVVYGPHESLTVSTAWPRSARRRGKTSTTVTQVQRDEPSLETDLRSGGSTQLYPRSQIDIYVKILQADGGNYSACVTPPLGSGGRWHPHADYVNTLADLCHVEGERRRHIAIIGSAATQWKHRPAADGRPSIHPGTTWTRSIEAAMTAC